MNVIAKLQRFLGLYVFLCISGCMGSLIEDPHRYAYVTHKGDADTIGNWTMEQTDGQKIYDGLSALSERMGATRDQKEAERASDWFLQIVDKIEDWPSDRMLSTESGGWTTKKLMQKIFSDVSFDAGHDPIQKELLRRLRPDEKHAQWLPAWEQSVAEQQRSP